MAAPGPASSCRRSRVRIWHPPSALCASVILSCPCLSPLTLLTGSPPLEPQPPSPFSSAYLTRGPGPLRRSFTVANQLGTDVQQRRHVDCPCLLLDTSPRHQRVHRGTCTGKADRATGRTLHTHPWWTPEGRRTSICGVACCVSSTGKRTFSPVILMVMSQELLSSPKNLRQN